MQDFFKNLKPQKVENALYVVATPIGNLGDITIRALQTLELVDFIICEDTRTSSILLSKFEIIKKKLLIYNDFSDSLSRNKILEKLKNGNSLALISDAGTPLISDPGYKLISFLRQEQQKIICIPGASSLTASISISGIPCDNFLFLGFLASSKVQKQQTITTLPLNYSFVFFEVANRLHETLEIIKNTLENRNISVARELTKLHEEVIYGKVEEVFEFFEKNPQKLRGEFVVIVEKTAKNQSFFSNEEIILEIENSLKKGKSVKDISLELSQIFDLNKKEIYKIALDIAKNKK
jgi:16S rRNA (cytidine1402-2'-O)-methyltransferase